MPLQQDPFANIVNVHWRSRLRYISILTNIFAVNEAEPVFIETCGPSSQFADGWVHTWLQFAGWRYGINPILFANGMFTGVVNRDTFPSLPGLTGFGTLEYSDGVGSNAQNWKSILSGGVWDPSGVSYTILERTEEEIELSTIATRRLSAEQVDPPTFSTGDDVFDRSTTVNLDFRLSPRVSGPECRWNNSGGPDVGVPSVEYGSPRQIEAGGSVDFSGYTFEWEGVTYHCTRTSIPSHIDEDEEIGFSLLLLLEPEEE